MAPVPTKPTSRLFRHLMPDSLGARLVLTVVLLALVTTATTIAVNATLIVGESDTWAREVAGSSITGFTALLDTESADLAARLDRLAHDSAFGAAVSSKDASLVTTAFVGPLIRDTGASCVVVLDRSGRALYSHGDAASIRRLESVAAAALGREVRGMLAIGGGPAFVGGAPVHGAGSSRASGGYVIVDKAYGAAQSARYAAIAVDARATVHAPGYVPDDVRLTRTQADSGESFSYGRTSRVLTAIASIASLDGGSAGVVRIDDRDIRTERATSAAVVSSLISGLAAVLIGAALGLWLTRLMRDPVRRMVEHVKTQGYLAAEGAPYSGEDLVDDPALPLEFRELGAVVEDLLRHLTARQSELKSAVRKAGYAEETLGGVNESFEAKIVLQDGRVVIANPAASVALGLPQSALFERTATEAFAETTVRREDGSQTVAHALLESALEGPTTVSLSRGDRPDRWYVVQAVRHADDLHNRILVSARDVTEERRLQSIRADVVSLISHDLRSPLSVVIGYLDLLRKPLSEEDRDRAIESAKKNAARMADLLEDLLSATRAEELLAPSELVPVPLLAVTEEVVWSMRETHPDQQLSLVSDRSPVVLGDEKRLRQAIVNLVTNAYKYAPPSSPIEVIVAAEDDHATIRVVDHGPGIPADERSRVFERLERLENGTSRPGIGLGLYIVQTIARNHGGSACAEETPGGGATFIIDLPLAGKSLDG